MIITIDGPSVSGKSTIASLLAKELNYFYLYSGLLYRAAAYVLHTHVQYDEHTIAQVLDADVHAYINEQRLVYDYTPEKGAYILFDSQNITDHLYTMHISQLASMVATNSAIRNALNIMQKHIIEHKNTIVDGRDSGSVLFPHAEYKLYITATPEERARRMQHAYAQKNVHIAHTDALKEILQRDQRDSNRKQAPLIIPQGALIIDSTDKTIQEMVSEIRDTIKRP